MYGCLYDQIRNLQSNMEDNCEQEHKYNGYKESWWDGKKTVNTNMGRETWEDVIFYAKELIKSHILQNIAIPGSA